MRKNGTLAVLLIIGVVLLVALSVANLVVSKKNESRVDRLISYKVTQALQSEALQKTVDASVQENLSKIVVSQEKGDKGESGQSIIGPQGEPGINGKEGANGVNGKDGASGTDGKNGKDGDQGVPGKTLELRWSALGLLQTKYTTDDFWVDVSTE